jgi:hypothetical protein
MSHVEKLADFVPLLPILPTSLLKQYSGTASSALSRRSDATALQMMQLWA